MYYSIGSITYCFPFGTRQRVSSKGCSDSCYGVLAPYINKKMTEDEADEFLCKVIYGHPYIEDAMWLDILVEWHDGCGTSGIYQNLSIKNPNSGKENKQYFPSPIRWRRWR